MKYFNYTFYYLQFYSVKSESELCNGEKFSDAYEMFRKNDQLIAIGINCTYPLYVTRLLKSVKNYSMPFVVYPNGCYKWDPSINR